MKKCNPRVILGLLLLYLSLLASKCEKSGNWSAPCAPILSTSIPDGEYQVLLDGSLAHENLTYPPGAHWQDGNGTRGCICRVAPSPCLRKCCGPGELLSPSLSRRDPCMRPADAESPDDGARAGLGLEPSRAAPEMRARLAARPRLADWFTLFRSPICAEELVFMDLNPDRYPEDAHLLHANGSLWLASTGLLATDMFCVDWQLGASRLAVLVCLQQDVPEEETPTAVRIGYVLSVPFLAVTFLVYAIIPELRNIYGKTLMCYVLSLLSAYSSIFVSNFFLFGTGCHITDKRSNPEERSTGPCGNFEFYNSCSPTCERNCDDVNNDDRHGEHCFGKNDCVEKCVCKKGYIREKPSGRCIRIQECPRVKH